MAQINIQPVMPTDLDICAQIIRTSFMTVAEEFGLTFQNCPTNGAFTQTHHLMEAFLQGDQMYQLCFDDTAIGFMQLAKKEEQTFELRKICVLPEYRHMGGGKMLLEYCMQKVKDLSGSKITIGIIEENTQLKEWYLSHGFIHTGTATPEQLPFTVGFMEYHI